MKVYSMRILVLTGWSQSGKDTVADILVKKHSFVKYAIADPLKDYCSTLFGFPRELADTQEGKKTLFRLGHQTKTIRQILIHTAKEDRARFGDSIYIQDIMKKISNKNDKNIVISDLRYFTELHVIQRYAKTNDCRFEIWKIIRAGQIKSPVDDPSEYGLETLKPHKIISNPGTNLAELEKIVSDSIYRKNELSNTEDEDDGCCIM